MIDPKIAAEAGEARDEYIVRCARLEAERDAAVAESDRMRREIGALRGVTHLRAEELTAESQRYRDPGALRAHGELVDVTARLDAILRPSDPSEPNTALRPGTGDICIVDMSHELDQDVLGGGADATRMDAVVMDTFQSDKHNDTYVLVALLHTWGFHIVPASRVVVTSPHGRGATR
jgi:hypothetical protein